MMLPVSGLVQVGLQSMADRYTYLPAIGLGILVVWGVTDLAAKMPAKSGRVLAGALGGAALVACVGWTHQQLGYWRNTETLMEHVLQIDPNNYVAHQNLARYYFKLGQAEIAAAHRQKVRELDPALAVR
jgi:tetratricopeptide (TPR) repeat protein